MRRRNFVLMLALGIAALTLAVHVGGQGVAVPPAPAPSGGPQVAAPSATGTGLILGRVLDTSSGKPIQGATVTASSISQSPPAGPAAATSGFRPQTILTGADGAFVFRNLPKGTFALRAGMTGYLNAESGGAAASASAQSVPLDAGEKLNDVELRLWRFGVLTGQVLDEQNEAVEGISIFAVRIDTTAGRRSLRLQQSVTTDDRGVYRMTGLAPGEYGVCALFSRHIAPIAAGLAQASGTGNDMRQTLGGSGAQSPSGSGYRVGDFMLISGTASRNVDPAPGEDGRLSVFADVCYPSAPAVQGAQAVRVDSGQERSQLNMVLRIVPSARILGTITGPSNRLSGMAVHLFPAAPGDSTIIGALEASQTVTDPSGGFGFVGVPAGSYVLRVAYVPPSDQGISQSLIDQLVAAGGAVPPEMLARLPSPLPSEPTLWASAEIQVGDTDVTGVALVLREGARVSGRIVFDGAKDKPTADRLPSAGVGFDLLDGSSASAYAQPRARFLPDGTFATPGVVPGRYVMRLQGAWPGWTLKSIMASGRDVSDNPLDIGSTDLAGVVITMTDRASELSGVVRGDAGAPDRRARVLVFPAEPARWTQAHGGRRVANTGVSRQGTFLVAGLPAGDYFVVAVSDQIGLNWQDPGMLDALSRSASHVTIRDGERRTVDLVTSVIR